MEASLDFSTKLDRFWENYLKRSRLVRISALFYDIKPDASQLSEIQTSSDFGTPLYMMRNVQVCSETVIMAT